jgi:hypothetical protein
MQHKNKQNVRTIETNTLGTYWQFRYSELLRLFFGLQICFDAVFRKILVALNLQMNSESKSRFTNFTRIVLFPIGFGL